MAIMRSITKACMQIGDSLLLYDGNQSVFFVFVKMMVGFCICIRFFLEKHASSLVL